MSQPEINVDKIYLEIEQKVINLMLQHLDIISEMLDSNIGPDFFFSKHRPLVQAIYYTYNISQGKRLLTDDHYRTLLIEKGVKGEITIAMQVFHECMYGVHFSNTKENFDLLKKQLIESFVHRKSVSALKLRNENVPKLGRLEATRQYVEELSSVLNLTEIKKSTSFLLVNEIKDEYLSRIESKINKKEPIINFKIPELDESMTPGLKPGHTTLIVGAPGSNKSNLMLNMALNIWKQNYNVLFLPLEMDWDDFLTRAVSNIADVSYTRLLNPILLSSEEHKRVKEASLWLLNKDKFAILDVDEQISIPVLRREIEKRVNYFSPKLVVVDYLGLLKTQSGFGQRHDMALGDLTKQLKFLGKKFGFHILTAAQLGRTDIKRLREEGTDAQLDSTAVRGSQEVSADVEYIMAITKVPDEDDRLKIHWIKVRYGKSGFTCDLRLDADKCRILSMKPTITSSGIDTDVLSDADWLNETPTQISEKLKEKHAKIEFDSMSPDDLDTI